MHCSFLRQRFDLLALVYPLEIAAILLFLWHCYCDCRGHCCYLPSYSASYCGVEYVVPQSSSSTIHNSNNILKLRSHHLLTFMCYHLHLDHDHCICHVRLYHSAVKFVWQIHCSCLGCSLMSMRHFAVWDY